MCINKEYKIILIKEIINGTLSCKNIRVTKSSIINMIFSKEFGPNKKRRRSRRQRRAE